MDFRISPASDLGLSLLANDPYIYAYLVKFERPLVDLDSENIDGEATDYSYITDSPYNIEFDDLSTDSTGTLNGSQTYIANKLQSVGAINETVQARASNLSLKLSSSSLGLTTTFPSYGMAYSIIYDYYEIQNSNIRENFLDYGYREGDIILIEIEGTTTWNSGSSYVAGDFVVYNGVGYTCVTPNSGSQPPNANWSINNHNKKARIYGFSTNPDVMRVTPMTSLVEETFASSTNYNITYASEEINALTFAKSGSVTQYTNYINREVFIYKAHISPATGSIIGSPILIFKGIISNGKIVDNPGQDSYITWTLSSHWADFIRVQGRRTSDTEHRAIDITGRSDEDALLNVNYAYDFGFMHAEKAVNVIATYQAQELRYKQKKKGRAFWDPAGFFTGGTKLVEYYESVDRDVDLRFNITARYLPVVYGVQKIDGIPVFADVAVDNAQEVYLANALCEGPIGGIYDVYIDDVSSVCVNALDQSLRSLGSGAEFAYQTARGTEDDSAEANNVDVVCYGRADRGDVLSGLSSVGGSTTPTYRDTGDDLFVPFNPYGKMGNTYTPTVGTSRNIYEGNPSGIQHEDTFTFELPMDATIILHSGRSDQDADTMLVDKAQSIGFKIQADYFDGDPNNYWSTSHRMLDTAYVASKFTIREEEVTIPKMSYVVKGVFVDCYNYDNSFAHLDTDISGRVENAANFSIGDTVDIFTEEDLVTEKSSGYIIDKWTIYTENDELETRFRIGNIAGEVIDLNIGTNTRFFMKNVSGSTWTMITHNHSYATGNVTYIEQTAVNSVSFPEPAEGEDAVLTITLTDPVATTFNNAMIALAGSRKVFVAMANKPEQVFQVDSYNSGTRELTIIPHATSYYYISNILATIGSDIAEIMIVNVVKTNEGGSGEAFMYNNKTLKITRQTNNIPLRQYRKILWWDDANDYAVVSDPFDSALIPSSTDTYDILESGDKRVSNNPAMQVLDYMTNTRYGKGLSVDKHINLDSFLESARLCDDRSKITIVIPDVSVTVGEVYELTYTDGSLAFAGEVESVSSVLTYRGTDYKQVVFNNVVGKLGRKWNDWETFKAGEVVWGFDIAAIATSTGTLTEAEFRALTPLNDSTNKLQLDLRSGIGTDPLYVMIAPLGGLKGTNNVVRAWTNSTDGFSTPGYSLHDCDDVKYWKYLGWEAKEQRYVTRHQTNMVINTSNSLFDNINSMLGHFNGMLVYSGGEYYLDVRIAAPVTGDTSYWVDGVTSISENDIIGQISLDDKGQKSTFNSITASIVDPANGFGTRAISFFNSDYLKEDKGIPRKGNYAMPGISNYYVARTNIKQYLEESRYGLSIQFTMDQKGLMLVPGMIIRLDYSRFAWTDKLFRIENINIKANGLVDIVAREHNDDAFLVEDEDRGPIVDEINKPPSPPVITPPTNLTATDDRPNKIVLTWEHSADYDENKYFVQVWGVETTQEGDPPEWLSLSRDHENIRMLTSTAKDNFVDEFSDGLIHGKYYWIRYVVPASGGYKERYSAWEPLSKFNGIFGQTVVGLPNYTYDVYVAPLVYEIPADSTGLVNPASFAPFITTITATRTNNEETEDLIYSAGVPSDGEFSVVVTPEVPGVTIDTTPNDFGTYATVDAPTAVTAGVTSTTVQYDILCDAAQVPKRATQTIIFTPQGKNAYSVYGSNTEHIFICDDSGNVINNDFNIDFDVAYLGTPLTYDDSAAPANSTYNYGSVGSGPGTYLITKKDSEIIVNVETTPGSTYGQITVTGDFLTSASSSNTTWFAVPIYLKDGTTLIRTVLVNLRKVFSGVRGGSEWFIDAATATYVTSANAADWADDLSEAVTAQNVAREIIENAEGDGFIRPNDRITVIDSANNIAATRIFVNAGISNYATVSTGMFSSIVTEFFNGSVIVDDTLSAEKLVANSIFGNNVFVGSNLVLGAGRSVGTWSVATANYYLYDVVTNDSLLYICIQDHDPGLVDAEPGVGSIWETYWKQDSRAGDAGQFYTVDKTSLDDTSAGIFMDHAGNFVAGDQDSYIKYDANTGQTTIKGNVVIDGGNTQITTWEAFGDCALDSTNTQVTKTANNGTYSGNVRSNRALSSGATATCEPANATSTFAFGLSSATALSSAEAISNTDHEINNIAYSWELINGIATARINGASTAQTAFYNAGDKFQVTFNGTDILWYHNATLEHQVTAESGFAICFWKGVFKDDGGTLAPPIAMTRMFTFKEGVISDNTQGNDGDDALSAHYTNTAHTVPVTNTGSETWTGSGGNLFAYEGSSALTLNTNTQTAGYPGSVSEYNIDIVKISGNTLTEPTITGAGTSTATLGNWAGNLTTVTVYRANVYITTSGGANVLIPIDITLTPSFEGDDGATGADGEDAISINYTNNSHSVPVTIAGAETWTGSGGLVNVYEGPSILSINQNTQTTSYPGTSGRYNLNITNVSGDTLTEPTITGAVGTTATLGAWAGDLTTATVYRITAYIRKTDGTLTTRSTDVTLTPAFEGATGATGATGDPGDAGEYGVGMYSIDATTTAKTEITASKINGAVGRAYALQGDVCIVRTSTEAAAYKLGPLTVHGGTQWTEAGDAARADWDVSDTFIDGDMVVAGGIDARELRISNLTTGAGTGIFMDGANTCIKIYDSSVLRVKLGNLA